MFKTFWKLCQHRARFLTATALEISLKLKQGCDPAVLSCMERLEWQAWHWSSIHLWGLICDCVARSHAAIAVATYLNLQCWEGADSCQRESLWVVRGCQDSPEGLTFGKVWLLLGSCRELPGKFVESLWSPSRRCAEVWFPPSNRKVVPELEQALLSRKKLTILPQNCVITFMAAHATSTGTTGDK